MWPLLLSLLILTVQDQPIVRALEGKAPDEKDAQAILRRGIEAHGGADRLARTRFFRESARGTLHVSGMKIPFTSDLLARMPNQFRNVIDTEISGRKRRIVQVFDGQKGWINDAGDSQKVDAATRSNWKEMTHAAHVAMLTPLLARDKGFELTALGESEVLGRKALGIKVSRKGNRDVTLHFDRQTCLLVKKTYLPYEGGKEVLREEVYSDFKEFDGLKRHSRVVVLMGGIPHVEAELIAFKVLAQIADKEFRQP